MPFNSDSSFWTYLDSDPLGSAADYRRYIARMRDIPRYFDEQTVNMRAGLARGFSVPRATLDGRDASIAAFADATRRARTRSTRRSSKCPRRSRRPSKSGYAPRRRAAIEQSVVPAYRKLLGFIRDEYMPKARTTIAARDLPDGDAFYRAQIREYTTTDMSPEEIHQLGLKEVARIDAEMRKTMAETGFKGSLADFLKFLKTDPQFYAKTPDELMGVSAYVLARVNGKVGKVIGTLPRRRFGLAPVADSIAPFYTSGRGGVGPNLDCTMNTYNLPTRPLYNIPALTLHECAPGHSLQIGIQSEQKALPRFRKYVYFSSTGEGWGLYSEWLGNEMGIYRTPYERFGQLSYEMWRAARLVIDTGIHRYGWSRQQAIDYLAGHTALSQPRGRDRDRPLHQLARSGSVIQNRRADDPAAALRSRGQARAEVRRARLPRHDPGARVGAPVSPRRPDSRVDPGGSRKAGEGRFRSASPGRYNRRRSWPARPSARCRRAPPHRRTP